MTKSDLRQIIEDQRIGLRALDTCNRLRATNQELQQQLGEANARIHDLEARLAQAGPAQPHLPESAMLPA